MEVPSQQQTQSGPARGAGEQQVYICGGLSLLEEFLIRYDLYMKLFRVQQRKRNSSQGPDQMS
jgi:hypothetical protein